MDAVPSSRLHSQRWRPLTAGETAMAAQLLGDAVDCCKVRIFSALLAVRPATTQLRHDAERLAIFPRILLPA